MDSSAKISSPSQGKSTSKVVKKIHTMSWLKQDLSTSKNSKSTHQAVGKDGKIISQKKTDEDYFPGTKDLKKTKKKKGKKAKSAVVIGDLHDLVNLTQHNEKRSTTGEDKEEIWIDNLPIVEKEVEIISGINTNTANGTVWSNTSSTAEKLFPNVQSVRIDRLEEEEMLSRAIAESIATVQLEQFKRPSPEKGGRWEALYGDFEDEGSWDNVRRNLPSEPETTNSRGEASGQTKSRDDNNNRSKTGILRKTRTNLNRYLTIAQEHDFCFKTPSESSKDELEKAQSLKSVSFDESIAVRVRSSESSVSDESDSKNENKRGPSIDKYGRVDGYSERRLFMGKGARIREQEYIQNQCRLGAGDLDLESNSKATAINKAQKPDPPASKRPKSVQTQEPTLNVENPKSLINKNREPDLPASKCPKNVQTQEPTLDVENHKSLINKTHKPDLPASQYPKNVQTQEPTLNVEDPKSQINKNQKPDLPASKCLKNVQAQEPTLNVENPKSGEAIAVNNGHEAPDTGFQKSESNSKATTIVETPKPAPIVYQGPENVQSPKSISNLENPKSEDAIVMNNCHKTPETRFQKSKSNCQATASVKTQKPAPNTSNCPRNVQFQKSIPNSKNPKSEKAIAANNYHKTSDTRFQKSESNSKATAIVKSQKPALDTSRCPRNIQTQKFNRNFQNPKTERATAVNKFHKTPETRFKKSESNTKATAPNTSDGPRSLQSISNSNNPKTEKEIGVKNVHRTPETSKDVKRVESNVEKPKSLGNRPSSDIASNTSNFDSSSNQNIDSQIEKRKAVNEAEVESSLNEVGSLAQKKEITETTDAKDSQGKILSADMISKDSLTVLKTPEDESDSGGPCLVPTLVRQEGYMPNLLTSIFQQTESTSAMSEAEFLSPARQNLLLAGVTCQDVNPDAPSFTPRYLDPKNSQYQNYSIPDSVSLLQSQSLNNVQDTQAECGDQIYQNSLINCNAYSMMPNYAKMYETAYFMQHFETGLPRANDEYVEPIADLYKVPAHNGTVDDRRRFLTAQAPPGFIKNLRLPSGFTSKESRRCDTDEMNPAINSPAVTQKARDSKFEKVEFADKKSPAQNRSGYYKKNSRPVQTNSNSPRKQQNFHMPQTAGSYQEESQLTENRKVPYPILGANQRSDGKYSNWKRFQSKTSQSSNSRRDTVDNRSPNTRENYRRPSPNNNNYSFRGIQNRNSDFNYQEMNDTSQDSLLGLPAVMFQMPDRLSQRSSNVSNWQYDVNFMDPAHVSMNLSPYYQMPMPNPHILPENISPDYFHAPIHPNGGFHQLPMHLQMPVYSIPHLMNTGVPDAPDMRLEDIGFPDSS